MNDKPIWYIGMDMGDISKLSRMYSKMYSGEETEEEEEERLKLEMKMKNARHARYLEDEARDKKMNDYKRNTDILFMIDYLKTKNHKLVLPILDNDEVVFIKNKLDKSRGNGSDRYYPHSSNFYKNYLDKENYIYSVESKKFLKRTGTPGRALEILCKYWQFPHIYDSDGDMTIEAILEEHNENVRIN